MGLFTDCESPSEDGAELNSPLHEVERVESQLPDQFRSDVISTAEWTENRLISVTASPVSL